MIHTPGGYALLQGTVGSFPGQSAALPEVEELQQKEGQQRDDLSACVCMSTTISFGQRLGKALFGPWFVPAFALSNRKNWLVATLLINLLILCVNWVYSNWKRCGVHCCLYPGQEARALQVWFWTHACLPFGHMGFLPEQALWIASKVFEWNLVLWKVPV